MSCWRRERLSSESSVARKRSRRQPAWSAETLALSAEGVLEEVLSDVPLTNPDPTKTTSYRLARGAVIILGVLLALAFVLLVVGLVWRLSGHKSQGEADGPSRFMLATGTRIVSTETQPGRLIVRVRLPDGEEDVDIIDTETGRLVGQVKAPPAGAH